MKRSEYIFTLAAALLLGCTLETPFETVTPAVSNLPLELPDPLVAPATRSGDVLFPNDKDFGLVAVWHPAEFTEWNSASNKEWVSDVSMSHSPGKGPEGSWRGTPAVYWPKKGYLSLQAYAPYSLSTAFGFTCAEEGLTLTDYVVTDPTFDIMYADRVTDQTKPVNEIQHNEDCNPYYGVQLVFHHAMACLEFLPYLADTFNGVTISIKQVTVEGLEQKATFEQGLENSGAAYKVGYPKWTLPAAEGDKVTEDCQAVTDEGNPIAIPPEKVYKSYTYTEEEKATLLGNLHELCIIPQNITGSAKMVVDYTVQISGGTPINQKFEYPLSGIKDNEGDGTTVISSFESGKKYTFNLVLGPNKIYFNASVRTWGSPSTPLTPMDDPGSGDSGPGGAGGSSGDSGDSGGF